MKTFTDQEINDAAKNAPFEIQEELNTGDRTAEIITNLGKRLALHVDVVGKIGELNRNMLLGLINPQEFQEELRAANIPETQEKEIILEINQKIFVPLQQKMRGGKPAAPTPVPSYKPTPPPLQPVAPMAKPVLPTIQPVPKAMPTPPPQAKPAPLASAPRAPRVAPAPPANLPGAIENDHLLPDHEAEHINVSPKATPAAPRPVFNNPATVTPPSQAPKPHPLPPTTPPPTPKPIAKYSVDPYREPFDDKS